MQCPSQLSQHSQVSQHCHCLSLQKQWCLLLVVGVARDWEKPVVEAWAQVWVCGLVQEESCFSWLWAAATCLLLLLLLLLRLH